MSACERSRVKISTSGLRGPRVRSGPSNQGGSGIYPLPGSVHVRIACFSKARAFSSEVDTGSREENASKQKIRARF